jgi:hypothetical protein
MDETAATTTNSTETHKPTAVRNEMLPITSNSGSEPKHHVQVGPPWPKIVYVKHERCRVPASIIELVASIETETLVSPSRMRRWRI